MIQEETAPQTFSAWLDQANVVLEVIEKVESVIVPLDIQVEVPDTGEIRRMLIDGKL